MKFIANAFKGQFLSDEEDAHQTELTNDVPSKIEEISENPGIQPNYDEPIVPKQYDEIEESGENNLNGLVFDEAGFALLLVDGRFCFCLLVMVVVAGIALKR